MANTNMTIRTDKEIKQQAAKIFSDLGMDMTTAVNVFLRQAIQHNGFPFEIKMKTPNLETLQAIENVKKGRGMSKTFSSVEALMEDLNADD